MEFDSRENKYLRAKAQVAEMKKFYTSLMLYVVFMCFWEHSITTPTNGVTCGFYGQPLDGASDSSSKPSKPSTGLLS